MSFRAIRVVLLLSSLPVTGCGTVTNLVKPGPVGGGKVPFGGVREDVWCLQKAAGGEPVFGTHPKSGSEQHARVAIMLFCAADLPLSLVGDVVTWPYIWAYSYINAPIPTPPVTLVPAGGVPPVPLPAALPEPGNLPTPPVSTLPPVPTLPEPRKLPDTLPEPKKLP